MLAIELSEKLLDTIKRTNDEKRLMLKYKQFNQDIHVGASGANPEE